MRLGSCRRGEFGEKGLDAGADFVADGPYGFDALVGGVVEFPVEVGLSGEVGRTSPQPMVMTTVDASESSTVRIFGVWSVIKMAAAAAKAAARTMHLDGRLSPACGHDQRDPAGASPGEARLLPLRLHRHRAGVAEQDESPPAPEPVATFAQRVTRVLQRLQTARARG